MPVHLNHTIVRSRDKHESATFLSGMLGLAAPVPFGPFLVVEVDNGVSLDFDEDDGEIVPQHYAFLVSEAEFDQILGRIQAAGLDFYADPGGYMKRLQSAVLTERVAAFVAVLPSKARVLTAVELESLARDGYATAKKVWLSRAVLDDGA